MVERTRVTPVCVGEAILEVKNARRLEIRTGWLANGWMNIARGNLLLDPRGVDICEVVAINLELVRLDFVLSVLTLMLRAMI